MNPQKIATEILPRIKERHGADCPPVFLSIPSVLSDLPEPDGRIEDLLEKFLSQVLEISYPARSVRIAVHEKKTAADLEQFFSISPLSWFRLSVECQSASGLEDCAKDILKDFGYRCPEWIGVEGSEAQLGAFHLGDQKSPSLILFIQNHMSRRSCDFLIPIVESAQYLAHAI